MFGDTQPKPQSATGHKNPMDRDKDMRVIRLNQAPYSRTPRKGVHVADTEHTSTTSTMTKRTRSAAKALSGANQDAAASCSLERDARRASKAAPTGAAKTPEQGLLSAIPEFR